MRLLVMILACMILCSSVNAEPGSCNKKEPKVNFSPKRTESYIKAKKEGKETYQDRDVESWFNKKRRRRKKRKNLFQWITEVDRKFKENWW